MKNTVADLIKLLQTIDPNTEVKVLAEFSHNYSTTTRWVDLECDTMSDTFLCTPGALYLGDG